MSRFDKFVDAFLERVEVAHYPTTWSAILSRYNPDGSEQK